MKWAKGTCDSITGRPYFYRSDCGNFTVTIPTTEGLRFGAWRVIFGISPKGRRERTDAENLGYFPSSAAARRACEAACLDSPHSKPGSPATPSLESSSPAG